MLMFKAKLTSSKLFDISSFLTNCDQELFTEILLLGHFNQKHFTFDYLTWMEAELILSIQLIKQVKNISILSRAWAQGWV